MSSASLSHNIIKEIINILASDACRTILETAEANEMSACLQIKFDIVGVYSLAIGARYTRTVMLSEPNIQTWRTSSMYKAFKEDKDVESAYADAFDE